MNINELFDRPDQYLLAFEPPNGVFVEMDRDAYHQSIFCDGRIAPKTKEAAKVPLASLLDHNESESYDTPEISYIFHIAHCGSTLLARALDVKSDNIVYREPLTLRQLATEMSAMQFNATEDWHRRLRLATRLLGRRYNKSGASIVKGNVPVNFIIPELLAISADMPSIVLYFPLEHYLMAILRSPNHRKWVANIVNEMQHAITRKAPLEKDMSVAQAAASLWLAQIRNYHEAIITNPNVVSLNAEDLFQSPEAVLRAAFDHLGQARSDADIKATVESDLFTRYSKNPNAEFDNAARLARREALRQEITPELEEARTWITRATADNPLPAHLANPIFGESPELLMRA